ncbi:molybdopterin-binding protein [Paeniglutamicibacter cryotolerans]
MQRTIITRPLQEAVGQVLAADLAARYPIPHCATSAMDGYAVSGPGGWDLVDARVDHRADPGMLSAGQAARIVTGGVVPAGCTAILRSEQSLLRGTALTATTEPIPGVDIRPAGREAAVGEMLIGAGALLTPGLVAVAAIAGYDEIETVGCPPVRLLFTGDEVIASGTPAPGQVRDSFGPVLPACTRFLGGVPAGAQRIGDDRALTIAALDSPEARSAQLIISTGGTGHSDIDHLRPAAAALGAEVLIDSIDMRPGHPAMLSRFPDGRLLAALPGNPLAALMALMTLVEPILRGATGRPASAPCMAVSALEIQPLPGRHRLVPARWVAAGGVDALAPAEHVASAMMRGLGEADAILVLPPHGVAQGAPVPYLPLPW